MRLFASIIAAILLALVFISPASAAAPRRRVVIVVGPVGAKTGYYKNIANGLASTARSYGAYVVKIYSPYATWKRVKKLTQGANLLIYLGHGNGWPSPYWPYNKYTKNGFGLNRSGGHGNYNVRYYGAYYVHKLDLAKNAVVLFNHLCYASGSSEPGKGYPTLKVAEKRVDNYAAPFIHAGARAVFAYAYSEGKKLIHDLFRSSKTMIQIFNTGTYATPRSYYYSHTSWHYKRFRLVLDPWHRRVYYRSFDGNKYLTATAWRNS